MIFDAADLARSWLSVAIASSTDKDRPVLHRTVYIEQYAHGLRLVSTDSYMLLTAWVPDIEDGLEPEPDIDEAPIARAVAMDPHGRAKGFLAYALSLPADDSVEVRVDLGVVAVDDESRPGFAGMEARWVVLELPDVERLKLQIFEGDYPEWRKLSTGFRSFESSTIALTPDIVGRLAKVAKYHKTARLGWTWGGPNAMARLEVLDSDPPVSGLVMPCRWDVEHNAPHEDVVAEAERIAKEAADQEDES